ncbi:MAG TPA: protein-disulfide reductase DsbD domain-containing protein [Tepidiformaceae bacterium]|nr:protein-disulfide reductase DsbD domain-containing protein [Tepidiformaceae bacterium]
MLARIGALTAVLAMLAPWPCEAQGKGGNVQATLVAAGDAVIPGERLDMGVRLRMRPGWHVYWKNPGDSGLPPTVSWTLPQGFRAGVIEWPAPTRFLDEGLVTYGYHDEVILPVQIQTPTYIAGDSVAIAARVDWLECKDICVPGSATLRLDVPVRAERRLGRASTRVIEKARSELPDTAGWFLEGGAGPRAISLWFIPARHNKPRSAYFYTDEPLLVDYAAPQGFERVGQLWRVTMKPAPNADRNLDRLTGVLVINGNGGTHSVQVDVPLRASDSGPAPPQPLLPRRTPPSAAYVAILAGLAIVLALSVPRIIRRRTHHN